MSDTQFVLDKLNAPPYSMGLSSLGLAELGPQGLLQLVSDIFSKFHPKGVRFDVSKEEPATTGYRLEMFLRMVKYRPTIDQQAFTEGLAAGELFRLLMF